MYEIVLSLISKSHVKGIFPDQRKFRVFFSLIRENGIIGRSGKRQRILRVMVKEVREFSVLNPSEIFLSH